MDSEETKESVMDNRKSCQEMESKNQVAENYLGMLDLIRRLN